MASVSEPSEEIDIRRRVLADIFGDDEEDATAPPPADGGVAKDDEDEAASAGRDGDGEVEREHVHKHKKLRREGGGSEKKKKSDKSKRERGSSRSEKDRSKRKRHHSSSENKDSRKRSRLTQDHDDDDADKPHHHQQQDDDHDQNNDDREGSPPPRTRSVDDDDNEGDYRPHGDDDDEQQQQQGTQDDSNNTNTNTNALLDDDASVANEDEDAPPARTSKKKSELDIILDRMKPRRAKNTMTNEEIDVVVVMFMAKMDAAADADIEANRQEQPAIHKMAFLKEASTQLHKKPLQQAFLERGVFGILKRWLDPLPDGAMPNPALRATIFKILLSFPFSTDSLKTSEIGRAVNFFLTSYPQELPENKKLASKVCARWVRSLFNLTTDYRDLKAVEEARGPKSQSETVPRTPEAAQYTQEREALDNIIIRMSESAGPRDGAGRYKMHARIPRPVPFDFTIRPVGTPAPERDEDVVRRGSKPGVGGVGGGPGGEAGLTKRLQQLRKPVKKNPHAITVSIEGRGVLW
eukprot:gnl/Spiro4/8643_TR4523_c0_g1_i1.p1 gnl/Spiro4/8643_TR4523_c0_g1~~gnl/Spiro4/8643_TR4523_c0_g1_i1.p1  ORF type:complete len:522 (+),score=150.72 gnl/Spiro4/8643_TR4523_c0_g1_i1:39-1604(+)